MLRVRKAEVLKGGLLMAVTGQIHFGSDAANFGRMSHPKMEILNDDSAQKAPFRREVGLLLREQAQLFHL